MRMLIKRYATYFVTTLDCTCRWSVVPTDLTTSAFVAVCIVVALVHEQYVLVIDQWRLLTTRIRVRIHVLIPIVWAESRSEGGCKMFTSPGDQIPDRSVLEILTQRFLMEINVAYVCEHLIIVVLVWKTYENCKHVFFFFNFINVVF
jgi:hypothetical protein